MNVKKYRFCLVLFMIVMIVCGAISVYYYMEKEDAYRDGMLVQNEYAIEEAGKAAGRLLYQMLYNDKREFQTWVEYTRMYCWTGNEDNG